MAPTSIEPWRPDGIEIVPKKVTSPKGLVAYARQLTDRDKNQIVNAAKRGEYEMAASFLWSKTMSALKAQLESLGIDFLGELLDRPDIVNSPSVAQAVTDYDALRLAEELGMFTATESMYLRHGLDLVTHFTGGAPVGTDGDDDGTRPEMNPEDFTALLRASVQSVLGRENLSSAVRFSKFRRDLEEKLFSPNDEEVGLLRGSPYFFQRTTIRVLTALAKTCTGAALENALANFVVLVPALWNDLLRPERQSVGRCYAEVHAAGNGPATIAISQALLLVKGFDYVPEDLRSKTFVHVAQTLKNAHFGFNNFYNEPGPMAQLAALGTSIPTHALAACVSATLCVVLGNRWGTSTAAQAPARQVLSGISRDRWRTYLEDYLPTDNAVLQKIADREPPCTRWINLTKEYDFGLLPLKRQVVRELINFSVANKPPAAAKVASNMLSTLMG